MCEIKNQKYYYHKAYNRSLKYPLTMHPIKNNNQFTFIIVILNFLIIIFLLGLYQSYLLSNKVP